MRLPATAVACAERRLLDFLTANIAEISSNIYPFLHLLSEEIVFFIKFPFVTRKMSSLDAGLAKNSTDRHAHKERRKRRSASREGRLRYRLIPELSFPGYASRPSGRHGDSARARAGAGRSLPRARN